MLKDQKKCTTYTVKEVFTVGYVDFCSKWNEEKHSDYKIEKTSVCVQRLGSILNQRIISYTQVHNHIYGKACN